jgi:hypothetical protein
LFKGVAALGDTFFVDVLVEICNLSGVRTVTDIDILAYIDSLKIGWG